jgi:hypothetical protein
LRRLASLCLSFALLGAGIGAARGASADSVQERLDKARDDQKTAEDALSQAEDALASLLQQYQRLRVKLDGAARDVVFTEEAQDQAAGQLAEAQDQLDRRVTTAYEIGPAAAIDLFLGARSTDDFASLQVFVGSTLQLDDSSVTEITRLRTSLSELAAQGEARQAELAASVSWVLAQTTAAEAQRAAAAKEARAAGLKVDKLEKEEKKLEEARRAAAASLSNYLGSGGVGQGCASGTVHDLIVDAFAPQGQDQVQTALAVATRESNCRPNAYNATEVPPYGHASGVFQILYPGIWEPWSKRCGYAGADPFDPEANVAVAACTVADQGWWPWGF